MISPNGAKSYRQESGTQHRDGGPRDLRQTRADIGGQWEAVHREPGMRIELVR